MHNNVFQKVSYFFARVIHTVNWPYPFNKIYDYLLINPSITSIISTYLFDVYDLDK